MAEAGAPQVIVKIKRKRGHGGHHGGAWKVAYADFVTAMMALFIVLWLLTQADVELRQDIARYFRNPSVLSGGSMIGDATQVAHGHASQPLDAQLALVQGTGEDLQALRGHAKTIEQMLEESPDLEAIKDRVSVAITAEGLEIQIVDTSVVGQQDLLFEVGSADLKPELVRLLRKLAAQLGRLPNRLRIGGHTDARPFGSASGLTNWDLAFTRANNARKVLEGNGLRSEQVLSVEAFESRKLLKPEDPLAAENRRLSVVALHQTKHDKDRPGDEPDAEGNTAEGAIGVPDGRQPVGAPGQGPTPNTRPAFQPQFKIPGLPSS
jgi:chemotaxis protein MotB